MQPKARSSIRIAIGKAFYTSKRYIQWLTDGRNYSNQLEKLLLPYKIMEHKTLLLRQLKDVDMMYQHNKITNLKIAVERLNGLMIQPGDVFSYWRKIGKTTKNKGYVEGMVLHYGKFTYGVGGGLCQLSNLIYWMTLHTPLTVVERHRHSFDVFPDSNRTQPFGSRATCSYNYLDLQLLNETDTQYQLIVKVKDTHLVGEWRCQQPPLQCYEVYEKDHLFQPAYWGGYTRHNSIYLRVYNKQDALIDDQYITENHAIIMYEPLLESRIGKA